jgi:hypothetical protein
VRAGGSKLDGIDLGTIWTLGHAGTKTRLFLPPLSGRFSVPNHPGLKPWAILLDHFMVKKLDRDPPPPTITNHQSPITNHQSPITNHQSPFTNHLSPFTFHLSLITDH